MVLHPRGIEQTESLLISLTGIVLALGYLCARLGERLASGSIDDLAVYDLASDPSLDLFHLRGHLGRMPLARLPMYLQSHDLCAAIQRMQESVLA